MEGKILVINNGSTSTKIAYYVSEKKIFEKNLVIDPKTANVYNSIMDRREDSRNAILDFLSQQNVDIESIDLIMARGGLITPVGSGAYAVNDAMIRDLQLGLNGVHACNLSAIVADDLARHINSLRKEHGLATTCAAYIADPPLANDLPPELRLSGRPELTRRSAFHALNSRAVIRAYAESVGKSPSDLTAIVAHIGGGSSVSLHDHGKAIDVTDSLGGDGPISVERAGTVPAFPIIDICFSGRYTKDEVKEMLVGNGGAMSYFGTKDVKALVQRAQDGDKAVEIFLKAYCASVAKYIGYFSTDVCGKVDIIILTGGVSYSTYITDEITRRVSFLAPVVVYPGENEIESLAWYGYQILHRIIDVQPYIPDTEGSDDLDELYSEIAYVGRNEAEGNPGKRLRALLRDQLRILPRRTSESKADAEERRLRKTVASSYRGEPLWRLFRKPTPAEQAADQATVEKAAEQAAEKAATQAAEQAAEKASEPEKSE